jgi:hypothetical protein
MTIERFGGGSGFICDESNGKCKAGGHEGEKDVYSSIDECNSNCKKKSNTTTIIFIIVGILMLLALIAFAIIQYKTRDAFK